MGATGATGPVGPGIINWRGPWSASAAYNLNDAVSYADSSYICVSVPATLPPPDPAWAPIALGQTGPQGSTGVQGATGVGLPGTMGATGATGVGATGATGPKGATGVAGPQGLQGLTGLEWRGEWQAGFYAMCSVVSYNGTAYVANMDTVSVPPSIGWDILATKGVDGSNGAVGATGAVGLVWKGGWDPTISYTVGDAVFYTGAAYICVLNNSNARPAYDWSWNLLASQGGLGATGATGPIGSTGPMATFGFNGRWCGPWQTGLPYEKLDIVTWQGCLWVYNADAFYGESPDYWDSANPGFDMPIPWLRMVSTGATGASGTPGQDGATGPTFNPRGAWSSGPYSMYDLVSYAGSSYLCITSNLIDFDTPDSNSSQWQLIAQGANFRGHGAWNALEAYPMYAIVTYNGSSYWATQATNDSTVPPSSSSWQLLAQGISQ
jgi:hypothetical protein